MVPCATNQPPCQQPLGRSIHTIGVFEAKALFFYFIRSQHTYFGTIYASGWELQRQRNINVPDKHLQRALNLGLSPSLTAAISLLPSLSFGQATPSDYPAKPIRMLLPFAISGGADLMARLRTNRIKISFSHLFSAQSRTSKADHFVSLALPALPALTDCRSFPIDPLWQSPAFLGMKRAFIAVLPLHQEHQKKSPTCYNTLYPIS